MQPFNDIVEETARRFRQVRNATLLFSFGIFLCFCVAGFLTFVTSIILIFVVPFGLFIGTPIYLAVVVLELVVRPFFRQTFPPAPAALPVPTSKLLPAPLEKQQENGFITKFQDYDPVTSSPWNPITPLKSAFGLKDTPSPFLFASSTSLPPVHSDTLEQIRTPLIIPAEPFEASPNVLGLNLVDSPVTYRVGENPFLRVNYLEKLSDQIIDQILSYLPRSHIGILALVSKDLASRFRFRRIHSGTEYCPLSTFSEISRRPRLGERTRRLVVHKSFFRPPIRTQWLLEGSDPIVAYTSWKDTEMKKHNLLATVFKSCRRISSLTWNEARLPFPLTLLKAVELRLYTTLRHLDISAKHGQLLNYVNHHHNPSQLFRLTSVVIRDGFKVESMAAIAKFLKRSTATIRQIHLQDSNFGSLGVQNEPVLFELFKELPRLERVDFTRPLDLDMAHIPITHMSLERGLTLNVQDPIMTYTPYIRFEFFSPLSHVLPNLTNMILYLPDHINTLEIDHDTSPRSPKSEHVRTLAEVISAAVNLRVFAFNAPVPIVLEPTDSSPSLHMPDDGNDLVESGTIIRLSSDILEALLTKENLVSLSLMARVMTPHQLQQICENLHTLSHLAVFMSGQSIHISKYSQHFTKLPKLIALDVAIRSFDQTCPCGHERDTRLPHYEEGTAMGRLLRRFLPRIDMNGQKILGSDTNKHLRIVRLSRLGWHYSNNDEHEYILSMLTSSEEFIDQVERMWGPCEVSLLPSPPSGSSSMESYEPLPLPQPTRCWDYASDFWVRLEKEAMRMVFSPVSWTEFVPESFFVPDGKCEGVGGGDGMIVQC